jgi:outer membrane immunogenic protein
MKKLLLASAALIVMSAPGLAADMPVKAKPRPAVVPFAWNGCYKGINVGYGWANFHKTDVAVHIQRDALPFGPSSSILPSSSPAVGSAVLIAFHDFDFDGDYAVGGEQFGCNWQTGITVWGVEADIQITSIEARHYFDRTILGLATTSSPLTAPFSTDVRSALRWFGTVRGRVGWTVTPESFIYLTGGLAYGHVNSVLHFPTAAGVTTGLGNFDSNTHYGWTVGIGAEAKVARNFSAKIEYLYLDLGSQDYDFLIHDGRNALNFKWDQRVDAHIVRVGLNYQWDWGAPAAPWALGVGKGKGKAPPPVVSK